MLVPYMRKNNSVSNYNPFRSFDDFERAFWNDNSLEAFHTDIVDNGSEFVLEADLPGFKKEDIHVDLTGDQLTISAERHSSSEDKDKKNRYVRCERSYGSFSRSFDTTGINTDGIKGTYENGVLKLTLPKRVETQPESRRLNLE